jgi:hypothetical protein
MKVNESLLLPTRNGSKFLSGAPGIQGRRCLMRNSGLA